MKATYLQWKERFIDGDGTQRFVTPWSDPWQYEYPFDFIFDTEEAARQGLVDSGVDPEEAETWVLVRVTEETHDAEALTLDGREHTLTPGQRCWITVGKASVLINAETEGVIVDIYRLDDEDGECMASTGVHENDLLSEEED